MSSNLHLRWAELIVDGLVSAGVREVVVSPGSRSTPLILAASSRPELTCRVVVDERSAAYFALGQARFAGRPSALVCTSGTAGANYLPAVVEACEADVPLVVITADRPPELQARGALQTTSQGGFFREFVRLHLDLGVPDADPRALRGARTAAVLAIARSIDPRPGPVHLNAPFRKPVEPVPGASDEALDRIVSEIRRTPVARRLGAVRRPQADTVELLADACRKARRGLILAGPAPLGFARARGAAALLGARLGFPVLTEAASQLRFSGGSVPAVCHFEYLLPPCAGLLPDLVVQLGGWPTSAAAGRWLEGEHAPPRWVIEASGRGDPVNRAEGIVAADTELTIEALLETLGPGKPGTSDWMERWRASDAAVAEVLEGLLGAEVRSASLSEAGAIRTLVDGLPSGAVLMVANSLSIREVDIVCPPGDGEVGVIAQRGVSGIDGLISGVAGVAAAARIPSALVLGDLAFLHDVGGLAALRHATTAVLVVVLQNRGGRIFDLLPLRGSVDEAVMRDLFVAPQELDVGTAAAAFGLRFRRCTDAAELAEAVNEGLRAGVTVIEAVVSGQGVRQRRVALLSEVDRWVKAQKWAD